ncbi:hypothetical protein [Luteolibacter soli]|uniref:Uncharacterized protein n=1 Tax=Luteolibacter soli TaxID=3135280 RepID=A0ABU9AXV3_9BACT
MVEVNVCRPFVGGDETHPSGEQVAFLAMEEVSRGVDDPSFFAAGFPELSDHRHLVRGVVGPVGDVQQGGLEGFVEEDEVSQERHGMRAQGELKVGAFSTVGQAVRVLR